MLICWYVHRWDVPNDEYDIVLSCSELTCPNKSQCRLWAFKVGKKHALLMFKDWTHPLQKVIIICSEHGIVIMAPLFSCHWQRNISHISPNWKRTDIEDPTRVFNVKQVHPTHKMQNSRFYPGCNLISKFWLISKHVRYPHDSKRFIFSPITSAVSHMITHVLTTISKMRASDADVSLNCYLKVPQEIPHTENPNCQSNWLCQAM